MVRRGVAQSWYHVGRITGRLGRADQREKPIARPRRFSSGWSRKTRRPPTIAMSCSRFGADWARSSSTPNGWMRAEAEYRRRWQPWSRAPPFLTRRSTCRLDRVTVEVRLGEIVRRRRQFDKAIERYGSAIVSGQKILVKEPKHVMARVYLYEAHVEPGAGTKLPGEVRPGDG